VATGEDLLSLVGRHVNSLASECPPDTILLAQIVLVEGHTYIVAGVNPQVTEGGPNPEILRDKLASAVGDYLKLSPNVVWSQSKGDAPS
jgi:hypothetical protein